MMNDYLSREVGFFNKANDYRGVDLNGNTITPTVDKIITVLDFINGIKNGEFKDVCDKAIWIKKNKGVDAYKYYKKNI
jgi:hypothetical protein